MHFFFFLHLDPSNCVSVLTWRKSDKLGGMFRIHGGDFTCLAWEWRNSVQAWGSCSMHESWQPWGWVASSVVSTLKLNISLSSLENVSKITMCICSVLFYMVVYWFWWQNESFAGKKILFISTFRLNLILQLKLWHHLQLLIEAFKFYKLK